MHVRRAQPHRLEILRQQFLATLPKRLEVPVSRSAIDDEGDSVAARSLERTQASAGTAG
jgi:hypothetical protein